MVATRNAAGSSQATASTARPTESGLVGFWYFPTCFFEFHFFLSDPWFEFRNDNGSVPISLKELEFIHNYALKFLAERKFKDPFWSSAAPLSAIKPKFQAYLEGIDHRWKILQETPRTKAKSGQDTFAVKGFFKEYNPGENYQKQTNHLIPIDLLMDKGTCTLYKDCSKEVAKKMDAHDKPAIEALVTLAVMELQFMHGCDVDWNAGDDAALSPGRSDDNNDEESHGGGEDGDDGDAGSANANEDRTLDFASIDSTDVLSDEVWNDLDYPNPDEFVKCRESFALAILMFLSEDLSCKFPKLSGQVHAGWKKAFGGPVTFEQLVDRPEKNSTMFNEDEEEWCKATINHFVSDMNAEQVEELGITDEQLVSLEIPKPAAPAPAARRKVETTVSPPHSVSAAPPTPSGADEYLQQRAAADSAKLSKADANSGGGRGKPAKARSHPIPFPQHLRGPPGADHLQLTYVRSRTVRQ